MSSFVSSQNITLDYRFFSGYVDLCHPNHPQCVTGVTCTDCNDGFNPQLDVNCNLITFYDSIASVNVNETDRISLAVYPNPSTGSFVITSGKKGQQYAVEIVDAVGREVQRFNWDGERKGIDVSSQPKGVYYLSVSDGKSRQYQKLLVQ
jgi:hypothetical protein